jgi:hypothetical protein
VKQLDIFADAPISEDLFVVPESWPDIYGPWQRYEWDCSLGPHPTWEAFRAATEWESASLLVKKPGRIGATLAFDKTTELWTFGVHVDYKTSGRGYPPGYDTGGFRTKDACIHSARQHADIIWKQLEQKHAEEDEWRRKWIRENNLHPEDSDETGEEGMADRFEDEEEEA